MNAIVCSGLPMLTATKCGAILAAEGEMRRSFRARVLLWETRGQD